MRLGNSMYHTLIVWRAVGFNRNFSDSKQKKIVTHYTLLIGKLQRCRKWQSRSGKCIDLRLGRIYCNDTVTSSNLSRQIDDTLSASGFLTVVCSRIICRFNRVRQESEHLHSLQKDDSIPAILLSYEPAHRFKETRAQYGLLHWVEVISKGLSMMLSSRTLKVECSKTKRLSRIASVLILCCAIYLNIALYNHLDSARARFVITSDAVAFETTVEQIVGGAKAFGLLRTFCGGGGTIALVNETDKALVIRITTYQADEIVLVTLLRPHSYVDFSPPRRVGSWIVRSESIQNKSGRNPSSALFVFRTRVCDGSVIDPKEDKSNPPLSQSISLQGGGAG